MTESSSVIENGPTDKFLEIERGGGGVSACGTKIYRVVISKFIM